MNPEIILIVLFVLAWLVPSILLIRKEQPVVEGAKRMSPHRFMGIYLLVGPFVLAAISRLLVLVYTGSNPYFTIRLVFVLFLLYLVYGIVYSIKNKVEAAILPLSIIPIGLLVLTLFSGGFH